MPVPARRLEPGTIWVDAAPAGESGRVVVYARVSSRDQRHDLDLVRAADHLRADFQAPFLLIGHSLDGATVLAARHRIPEVRAAATIAAPADSDDMSQAERIADLARRCWCCTRQRTRS